VVEQRPSASISRSRMSVGFCSRIRAVLAWERMAAVSSGRVMSAASAVNWGGTVTFLEHAREHSPTPRGPSFEPERFRPLERGAAHRVHHA